MESRLLVVGSAVKLSAQAAKTEGRSEKAPGRMRGAQLGMFYASVLWPCQNTTIICISVQHNPIVKDLFKFKKCFSEFLAEKWISELFSCVPHMAFCPLCTDLGKEGAGRGWH